MFQGDVCHLVANIQVRRITHHEKEKIQSEFTADFKLTPSTLYRKKMMILRNDHLLVEIDQVQVNHVRVSKIHHQKTLYHAILLSPLPKK